MSSRGASSSSIIPLIPAPHIITHILTKAATQYIKSELSKIPYTVLLSAQCVSSIGHIIKQEIRSMERASAHCVAFRMPKQVVMY